MFVLLSCFTAFGQNNESRDTATVNRLLNESKSVIGSDSAKAISLALKAKEIANELKYSREKPLR